MSFILTPENHGGDAVKISKALICDLVFSFMREAGEFDIIEKYLSRDAETIRYRQALFSEILGDTELLSFIETLLERVEQLVFLRSAGREPESTEGNEMLFSRFRELLLFTDCIDCITGGAEKFRGKTKSAGLIRLFDSASELSREEWYVNSKLYIEKTCEDIKNIKSLTIGVNLDAQLCVKEAGLISVNPKYFVSNTLLDKMFAKKIEDKSYVCVEPIGTRELKSAGVSMQIMNSALYNAMSAVVGKTIRKIRQKLYDELSAHTYFLMDIYGDLQFISMCSYYILSMRAAGMPLCIPEISEKHNITSLYNPNLVGNIKNQDIVRNDSVFDSNGRIFILTGANSGGKSVFLRSVGIAQVLFQLGLPVPAARAEMTLCGEIFSHFSSVARDRSGGRFENECKNLIGFYKEITENSLVLLDEMFSTTGSSEGAVIAVRVLKYFASVGCRCVYATHMHELTAQIDEINSSSDIKSRADGLATEIIDGKYTHIIKRCRVSYGSYAEEICKKYGFDF